MTPHNSGVFGWHVPMPDYYIIPKNLFAKWIVGRYQDWLAAPGRDGHVHVDNPIRAFDKPQFYVFEKISRQLGYLNLTVRLWGLG